MTPASKIASSVVELVGRTPMVRLNRLPKPGGASVVAKVESLNPGGSVKDRIAVSMLEDAERRGVLKAGATIVEPTSGNTGIGLAMAAAVRGYRLILTMPDDMSVERQRLLARFGAELHLTPAIEGMTGAVHAARELLREHPDYFMPQQFENPGNPEAHRRTTALEILDAVGGRRGALVVGVGTGGPLAGVADALREKIPAVGVVAAEPGPPPGRSGGTAARPASQRHGADGLHRDHVASGHEQARSRGGGRDRRQPAAGPARGLVRRSEGARTRRGRRGPSSREHLCEQRGDRIAPGTAHAPQGRRRGD